MKRRVAIWIHGGVGNGEFSQGYPMLEKLFIRLGINFNITVYSHAAPNIGFITDKFLLKYPPRSIKSGKIRWLFLFFIFLKDHIKNRFHVNFAFWGYPIGFFAVIFKTILGIPCVIYLLGADSSSIPAIDYGIFHKRIPRAISTWAYFRANELLTTAEFLKSRLKQFGINRDIKVIPWGVDPMFQFSQKHRGEVLQVIHVANIHPVKDQTTLLKAFALIREQKPAQLKFFGLDCMDKKMNELCVELGIDDDVEFMGVVEYAHLPKHYIDADIMLHTSLSEAQCMALTEAVATGVLIAGTRVGLLYEIGEECGIVVEVGDYTELAKKVLDLCKKPHEWNMKVEKARIWADHHNLDWTIKKLETLLLTVTAKD